MSEIRALRPADAPACDAIVASLPYHFGHEEGRRECAAAVRSQQGLVGVEDGEVVGFLTILPRFDEAAEITWMAVHADKRRHGVGHALIDRLCDDLIAERCRLLITFTVSPSDTDEEPPDGYQATRAFYRKVGFVPARDFPDLWPGDLAVLLVRPL